VIIDTNVVRVADELSHADPGCVKVAVTTLERARECVVALDAGTLIMQEYLREVGRKPPYLAGSRFVQEMLRVQANPARCERVGITPHEVREFVEFPDDERLAHFHRKDRKFVAVAVARAGDPEIFNASDTDWWPVRDVLAEYGVDVTFICPQLMPDE